MVRKRCTLAAAVTIALATTTGKAVARPPIFTDAANEARADALRKEGNDLARAGKFREAVEAYRASFKLNETFAVAANLGRLELELHQHRDAAEHLAFALRTAPSDARPEVKAKLDKALVDAKKQVGALKILVALDDTEVTVDGRSVDWLDLGFEVFVDPGTHKIAATRAGYAAAQKTIAITAGERLDVELALVPLASPIATPAATVAPSSSVRADAHGAGSGARAPLIVAGASAATIGTVLGVVFTLVANGKVSQAAALHDKLITLGGAPCYRPSDPAVAADCNRLRDVATNADTFSNAAVWSFIGAGTFALGTGVAALWPKLTGKSASLSGVRVGPTIGGMVISGEL